MAGNEPLRLETDARGVRTLTLNRPERRNALDGVLISALLQALRLAEEDADVRVVILTGSGETFCAGADLRWLYGEAQGATETLEEAGAEIGALVAALQEVSKPVIARVNGPARGGGVGLICACDIGVGTPEATFAFTEVRLGLLPAVIMPAVIGAIGARQARRFLLSGEIIESDEALAIGLVHAVVAPRVLDVTVQSIAEALLQGGPQALAETKRLLGELTTGTTLSLDDRCRRLTRLAASEEGREGIAAFLEKRKPRWQLQSPSPSGRGKG
ncbi:MAG: enoyl-CoA hydratase-related protein [Chromatiales bacterium]